MTIEITSKKQMPIYSHLDSEQDIAPISIATEKWRSLIDRKWHGIGPYVFDNQDSPGYLSAMRKGLVWVDNHLAQKMDANALMELHDCAVDQTQNGSKPLAKGFTNEAGWGYGIAFSQNLDLLREWYHQKLIKVCINESLGNISFQKKRLISSSSLKDATANRKQIAKAGFLALGYFNKAKTSNKFSFRLESLFDSENRLKEVNQLFINFYTEIEQASNRLEQYAAIGKLCRALQVFHIFPDGNGRTICTLLFNLLMRQIKSPPGILKEPEVFDGSLTIKEMTKEIVESVDYADKLNLALLIGELSGMGSTEQLLETIERLILVKCKGLNQSKTNTIVKQIWEYADMAPQKRQSIYDALIENLRAAQVDNLQNPRIFKKNQIR